MGVANGSFSLNLACFELHWNITPKTQLGNKLKPEALDYDSSPDEGNLQKVFRRIFSEELTRQPDK